MSRISTSFADEGVRYRACVQGNSFSCFGSLLPASHRRHGKRLKGSQHLLDLTPLSLVQHVKLWGQKVHSS